MRTLWYVILLSTICLEGLGRKYLPAIPSQFFYFAKDLVLLVGFYFFRPPSSITRVIGFLFRGFKIVWIVAAVWTVCEMLNPQQQSYILGVIGLRSYWLWWLLAPPVMATVLQQEKQKRSAIYALLIVATGVSILAALQFAAPPDSALNLYSVVDGEEIHADQVIVDSTARARVSSTFSYISGFSDFVALVPALLLSIGLDAKDPKLRRLALIVTVLTAAVVPMSGSRTSIIVGVVTLVVTAWTAGLFATRVGRRIMVGGIVAAVFAVVIFPDALLGVQARFSDTDETNTRVSLGVANIVPPLALATFDYPPFGIGTGMMQNARFAMHIVTEWDNELEAARYLGELGPVGYLLVWCARLGLLVALFRAYTILKRAGRRGAAAAAISYIFLALEGSLTFDHVFQALYFMGCGFILSEVVVVVRQTSLAAVPLSEERAPVPARVEAVPVGAGVMVSRSAE